MRATAFLLEGRSHVRVQVQRDGYRAVSQHLRDDFGILSKLQHVGRERMPQIMKSEIRKSGLREEALIGDVESLEFHRGALLGGEDESLLSWDDLPRPFLARSEPLCELSRPIVASDHRRRVFGAPGTGSFLTSSGRAPTLAFSRWRS